MALPTRARRVFVIYVKSAAMRAARADKQRKIAVEGARLKTMKTKRNNAIYRRRRAFYLSRPL